ncbi:polysaccharide biosynthesis/export family protein [Sphingomonas bacterium]|uniref:polysaccharide biosynthesis/export family protein n=1 Tax=Sphingomonas bacterium TaxID=1895847 RepID=UPI0020C6C765|nr:polysaccharide biosynthesis/export family protein [Sphingomonas bacterium]
MLTVDRIGATDAVYAKKSSPWGKPLIMISKVRTRVRPAGSLTLAALLLSGCATLPASGPTAHDITKSARTSANSIGFKIVPVDAAIVAEVQREDAKLAAQPTAFVGLRDEDSNDLIGAGDQLQISIFEVGVALFGQGQSFDPSARAQTIPSIGVARDGTITLPYAGRLAVAGRTPAEVEKMIENGLRQLSQRPQAIVTLKESIHNSVIILGEVRRPGRYPLTLGKERLVDAVAFAGGTPNSAEDTIVRVTRGNRIVEERLGRLRAGDPGDFQLIPGDRIEFLKRPRTFLILGASGKVSQVPFETGDVSLAEAVARAGGPADATADPSAIFLFRYDQLAGAEPQPIVYRLNMMNPTSYFLAQHFLVRDKDVLYIGNAAANQPSKLIAVINQLFSPFVTARVLTQ